MPMPQDYSLAADRFDAFLVCLKDALSLSTRNQTYTVLQAVLVVFRRRLTADQVLIFAGILPPMVRAIFVAGWQAEEFVSRFGDRNTHVAEVKSLRRHHNFAPEDAIDIVSAQLRHQLDEPAFDAILNTISRDAVAYWQC